MRKILSFLYRNFNKFWITAAIISWAYTIRRYPKTIPIVSEVKEGLPKIAFICDEMTWRNFSNECNAMFVTPANWHEAFQQFQPDLFFCESAWSGIDSEKDCWLNRIHKNKLSFYENRKVLFNILLYCKKNGIPAVFWNKEDPAFFDNLQTNFTDTALNFDYVFTTAKECIPKYKAMGCNDVHLLEFGFSDHIFYYDEMVKKENTAVFAGSWYNQFPLRCSQMTELFDFIIAQGIELIIYNRNSDKKSAFCQFPAKYQAYLRSKVSFEYLGDIYRRSRYVVNFNTVTDSETMFARRVFEAMACGCIVISNESKGLWNMFGNRIWFYGKEFDCSTEDIIRIENIQEVFNKHTCSQRMKEILSVVCN